MTPAAEILRQLRSSGLEFCDADRLARAVHMPPSGVAAEIRDLETAGFQFEFRPEAGWRLLQRPDALVSDDIEASLRPGLIPWRIRVFRATASTNDTADGAGRSGSPEGLAIFAESQSAGRGRLGRQWESRPGLGLWFSVLLRPSWPAAQAGRLTVLAAVAVAEAVADLTGLPALIKWPNDIWVRGRKLAGILTELRCTGNTIDYAVVGVGINVRHDAGDFPPQLRGLATSVALESAHPPHRADLAAAILNGIAECCGSPFDPVRRRWLDRCCTLGRTVELREGTAPLRGIAESINEDGALMIRDGADRLHAVNNGDIIHMEPPHEDNGPGLARRHQ